MKTYYIVEDNEQFEWNGSVYVRKVRYRAYRRGILSLLNIWCALNYISHTESKSSDDCEKNLRNLTSKTFIKVVRVVQI